MNGSAGMERADEKMQMERGEGERTRCDHNMHVVAVVRCQESVDIKKPRQPVAACCTVKSIGELGEGDWAHGRQTLGGELKICS